MLADPAHFAQTLPARIAEYFNTKTIEAYLAATTLLNDVAHITFRALREVVRDTASEARKLAVKGLAGSVVTGIGSVLAKLAGIVPAELEWVLPWLKYVPKLLG